ncbi:hypothetical protein KIL84_010780 [Mauremys mutica]|uniref:Uncharacterized protein n=1 Tax=Mauremys mutica TaxID=74926 RepID=A0A9D3XC84_9SAUR|nr:hypothetical protein KIL84_010780 [Mauremys mutica]
MPHPPVRGTRLLHPIPPPSHPCLSAHIAVGSGADAVPFAHTPPERRCSCSVTHQPEWQLSMQPAPAPCLGTGPAPAPRRAPPTSRMAPSHALSQPFAQHKCHGCGLRLAQLRSHLGTGTARRTSQPATAVPLL